MLLRARSSYCCLIVHQSITIPAEPRCGMTDALHIVRHDCRAGSYPSLHARKWTPGVKIARYMHCTHQRMCTSIPQPAQRFRIGFHQSSKVVSVRSPDLGTDGGGANNVSLPVSQRIFLLRTQEGMLLRLLPLSPTPLPCRLCSAGSVTTGTLTG